ncbi:hypothetical protein BC829DRAFT_37241 [Chytridium lagenaria]|nr:hypothetical protein BC829DRAFT_37241 [Chytridium lagenaria]
MQTSASDPPRTDGDRSTEIDKTASPMEGITDDSNGKNNTPKPSQPMEYGPRTVCRELWIFELASDTENSTFAIPELSQLQFLEEGDFTFDTVYTDGDGGAKEAVAGLEGKLFVGAVLNLFERSFAGQGGIRMGDEFLLLPYYDKALTPIETFDLSQKLNISDRIRSSLVSVSISVQLVGTYLLVQPNFSTHHLRPLQSTDINTFSDDACDVVLAPSGIKGKLMSPDWVSDSVIQGHVDVSLSSNSDNILHWSSLLNLPQDLLIPSNPKLPTFVTVVLEDRLSIRYPTILVLRPAKETQSCEKHVPRVDYWTYRDPVDVIMDTTLNELGKGQELVDAWMKDEEEKRKREEEEKKKEEKAAAELEKANAALKAKAPAPSQVMEFTSPPQDPTPSHSHHAAKSSIPSISSSNDYSFLSVNSMPFLSTSAPGDSNDSLSTTLATPISTISSPPHHPL